MTPGFVVLFWCACLILSGSLINSRGPPLNHRFKVDRSDGIVVSTSRQYFRRQRKNLSVTQQNKHAFALSRHIALFLRLSRVKNVAIYLPTDGELSPLSLLLSLRHKKINFFLPVLSQLSFQGLQFATYNDETIFKPNKFNINEPVVNARSLKRASELDIIFLPLVAYDLNGNRMGMGGGFYDRALQIRQRRRQWKKPMLIGLAHTVQQAKLIESEQWDVPLDGIATEKGIHLFNRQT